jgi:aspartate carbamoyltransferase regulatory subunit|tara:strand:- start:339 stop:803 length:465 start_codon:yes stop_codon:yes gene_type:complete
MSSEKELKIDKIKSGTVIDHLPAGSGPTVLRILGIDSKWGTSVSVAMNVSSKSGKKDIVKVEDRILQKEETDKLGLIANNATINIVENYNVKEKHHVSPSEEMIGVLECKNPKCVTNQGEPVVTNFKVESANPLTLRCKYCERIMEKELLEEQL